MKKLVKSNYLILNDGNINELNHNLNYLEDTNSQGGLLEILYHDDEVYISYSEK